MLTTAIDRLTAALRDVIRELVCEELGAQKGHPDDWLIHPDWPAMSRRVACKLARAGAIPAHRKGRLWVARRRDVDTYVERAAPRKSEGEGVDWVLDTLRESYERSDARRARKEARAKGLPLPPYPPRKR